ncbi:MAG TPA: tetratricopeptide repeat protein, partial [Polyangium sp.]|nr:tetratricopeptide repeat protein [Polyangium sp.]
MTWRRNTAQMRTCAWRNFIFAAVLGYSFFSANFLHAQAPASATQGSNKALIDEAERLEKEMATLWKRGNFRARLPLAERVVELRKKAFGPDHVYVGNALNNLANVHMALGDYGRAEELFQNALTIQAKRFGPHDRTCANTHNNLGALYRELGDFALAEPRILESLQIYHEAPVDPWIAAPLEELGLLHIAKGEYLKAFQALREALTLYMHASGIEEFADYLPYLYTTPRVAYVPTADLTIFGIGAEHVANALDGLALLFRHTGNYAMAERVFMDAMKVRANGLAPEHPLDLNSLTGLGLVYRDSGDYVRAELVLKHALELSDEKLGPEHPDAGKILNSLGSVYQDKGDVARAEPIFDRALAIQEKVLGPNHGIVANTLLNLAGVYRALGQATRAEPLETRALAIQEQVLGKNHPDMAQTLIRISLQAEAKGDDHEAKRLLKRAHKIAEKTLGDDHPVVAEVLVRLGLLHLRRGEYAIAEPLIQTAMVLQDRALGDHHPAIAETLDGLALINLVQNRIPEAIEAAGRAAEIRDGNVAAAISTGSEEQKRLYMQALAKDTAVNLSLHVQYAPKNPDALRLALRSLLRRKGRVLDAMADGLATLRRSVDVEDHAVLDELTRIYAELAARASRGPGVTPVNEYRVELVKLEKAKEALESQIGLHSMAFRERQKLADLAEVRASIPRQAALVE